MHRSHRLVALWRFIRREARKSWLNYGVLWVGAVLVGLAAVLFANWTNDVLALFLRWIEGRAWLALLITPTLTAVAVWLTRTLFRGS
jgi:H+/Cl- antiporter ClcA